MNFLFNGNNKKKDSSSSSSTSTSAATMPEPRIIISTPKPEIVVLAIDGKGTDWKVYFAGKKLHGDISIRVEQGTWSDLSLSCYEDSKCIVNMRDERESTKTFRVDFVLMRQMVKGSLPGSEYTSILYGFEFAGIPSLNSFFSVYNFLERPWVFAHLRKIQKRLGREAYPLIDQYYHSSFRELQFTPEYPIVVKVGCGHAGYGKARVMDYHDLDDCASLVSASAQYCTSEHYHTGEYDLRIQKIGSHYRCFKRMSISGRWKTNTGSSVIEEIPMCDKYKMWADESSTLFGGLDILAVDAIHTESGEEYILEVNDTSIGIQHDNAYQDFELITEMVMDKLHQSYTKEEILARY